MIIFGWGHQMIKQIGVVFKNHCSHCNNEEYWILTRIMTWFTIFFIPIFPYSIKYFLSCPICKYGLTLDQDQIQQLKPLAETNQLLVEGKISEAECHTRINQLNSSSPKRVEARENAVKVLPNGNTELSFCAECGSEVLKEIKFCGKCGTQVNKI